MSRNHQSLDPTKLSQLLTAFLQAPTWEQAQPIVQEHPELLTDEADAVLSKVATALEGEADESWVVEHWNLLRRCREVGIPRAFAEKTLAAEDLAEAARQGLTPEDFLHLRTQIRPVLHEVLAELAAQGIEIHGPEDLEAALAARHDLRVRLERELGVTDLADDLRHAQEAEQHYLRTNDQAALDQAVSLWERILAAPTFTIADNRLQIAALNDAGTVFFKRYQALDHVDDFNRGIACLRRALEKTPEGSSVLPLILNNLGSALSDCFKMTGRLDDLEEAIRVHQRAVAEIPPGSPTLPSLLNNLGNGLRDRFERTGRLEDLDEAIRVHQRAVAETPEGSPDLPSHLNNLGNGLRDRFRRTTGRLEDLDEAIRVYQRAVAQTPEGWPDMPSLLNNMGVGLSVRFMRTGRLEDLDEAIRVYQRAVAETPEGSPDLPSHLNNLGNEMRVRSQRTGRLEDLEEAVRLCQRAVSQTPAGSLDLPSHLNNLGNGLCERFRRMGRLDDLEDAIRVCQRAVAQTPEGSPDLPSRLVNLSNGLNVRFGRTGRLEDLEESIRMYRRAVAQTPEASPYLPSWLSNLSIGLRNRFERTGRLDDLEESIWLLRRAVAQTPEGSSALLFLNLGNGLRNRFERTGGLDDLEEAMQFYRRGCRLGALSAPLDVVGTAHNWGRWAVQRKQWVETAEAYGYGLATCRQILARQLLRTQKESVLHYSQEMSAPAAYALAKLGRFEDAVTTVERGRARLLAEALQRNRSNLEQLPTLGRADLYQRYREIVETQERLTQPADARPDQPDHLSSQARLNAIVAANAAFDEAVAEIQKVPGYADFLAEPTFAEIQAAAQDAPLVYLLTTSVGGLALIVNADGVQPVWLDDLTDAAVLEWLGGPADEPKLGGWRGVYQNWLFKPTKHAQEAWFAVVDDSTRRLWSHIMEPVAAGLRRLLPAETSCAPEVTLIPAGLLALLPLHAAWTDDVSTPTRRRYFLDEFTVRYAPSALALGHAHDAAERVSVERLLAVDEPFAAGATRLPNAHAEITAIADLFDDPVILTGAQATRQAVLAALGQAQVAHFSCHGRNDWQNPLASGLLMSDDKVNKDVLLTVGDLLEARQAGGRLATLAACETGIVGTNLPDEVVMLPSALLQAGFAGVAASLWSVPDISTAMLMEHFYRLWREGNEELTPAQALRAAQRWVRDTTNGEKAEYFKRYSPALSGSRMPEAVAIEFFTQAMSRHLDDRDFAHPHWWAAFYLTGV